MGGALVAFWYVYVFGGVPSSLPAPWGWEWQSVSGWWWDGIIHCVGGAKKREILFQAEKWTSRLENSLFLVILAEEGWISWEKAEEITQSSGAFLGHVNLHSFIHKFSLCENINMRATSSDSRSSQLVEPWGMDREFETSRVNHFP